MSLREVGGAEMPLSSIWAAQMNDSFAADLKIVHQLYAMKIGHKREMVCQSMPKFTQHIVLYFIN